MDLPVYHLKGLTGFPEYQCVSYHQLETMKNGSAVDMLRAGININIISALEKYHDTNHRILVSG